MTDNVVVGGVSYATDDVLMSNGIAVPAGTAHYQRMKMTFGDPTVAVDVSQANPLPVNISSSIGNTPSVTAQLTSATATVALDVTDMGNGTIVLFGGTYTALRLVFEATVDGTNWFTMDVTRVEGSGTVMYEQFGSAAVRAWNYTSPGYTQVRVRVPGAGATNWAVTVNPSVLITAGPLLVDWSPSVPPVDGIRATYVASIASLSAAIASDLFSVVGSATKTVRISRVEISGIATTATATTLSLLKRSNAGTPGTPVAATVVPVDSGDSAATATSSGHTSSGSVGALVGSYRAQRVFVPLNTSAPPYVSWDFGGRPAKSPVLRGTAERVTINSSVAVTGASWTIAVEFTEE